MTIKIITKDQVSAGGAAFRRFRSKLQMVIVSVKPGLRWQLPKSIVDPGETPDVTAVREVRERERFREFDDSLDFDKFPLYIMVD